MAIPKIIHYCWFGRGVKKELILKCIESWKHYLPDYHFIEWNEDNFDVNSNKYISEAYENKKWAFVSDYVRIWAVYNYGGIYLDTDVEVKKSLDIFLEHKAFTGFESWEFPFTATFGAEKGHPWLKTILDYYDDLYFLSGSNKLLETTNTVSVSNLITDNYGIKCNGKKQDTYDGLVIYPSEYFTLDTDSVINYTTHHYDGSWADGYKKMNYKKFIEIKCKYQKIWPLVNWLIKIKRKVVNENIKNN